METADTPHSLTAPQPPLLILCQVCGRRFRKEGDRKRQGGGGLRDRIDGSMKEGRCVCVCLSEDFLLTLSSYDREN